MLLQRLETTTMKTSIIKMFDSNLFASYADSFFIKENDNGADVKEVNFIMPGGTFEVCTEKLWAASTNLYIKQSGDFSFRRKCDGVVICKKGSHNYIIWIELKSGFNQIFSDAIYQIAACYVKMKSYLRNFVAYNPGEYEEMGIVVSLPENTPDEKVESNKQVTDRRASLVSQHGTLTDKCRRRYRRSGNIELLASDFIASQQAFVPDIQIQHLPIFHIATNTAVTNVNLGTIIQQVFGYIP